VHLKEPQRDLSVRLAAAYHLDAVDRVERVLVVEQRAVSHVDERLDGAHSQQAVDVERGRADTQRNELRLALVRRFAVQHQRTDRVAVVVVDGTVAQRELVSRSDVVVAVAGAVVDAHRVRVGHPVYVLHRRHLSIDKRTNFLLTQNSTTFPGLFRNPENVIPGLCVS